MAIVLVALATLAATGLPTAPAGAASASDVDAELRRIRNEVADLDAKEARAAAELSVTRREREKLEGEVAALDRQVAGVEAELTRAGVELEEAIAHQLAAQQAVEVARAALHKATALLKEQAVQTYIRNGATPSVSELLATLEDVNDAPRVAVWVRVVTEKQAGLVEEQRRIQRETSELEAEAARLRDEVAGRHAAIAARRAEIARARSERAGVLRAVAQEQANEQRLLASLQGARAKAQARIQELEQASATVSALLRRRQAGQVAAPVRPGFLASPVGNATVSSLFGWRVHPIFGDSRLHSGMDFAVSTGTPVYAAADGVVVVAGWQGGYGNTVVIDHGGAIATLYAHNSSVAVSEGARVRRGQRVASAGSTGNSTGPHVHFEVRRSGQPVDPLGYL